MGMPLSLNLANDGFVVETPSGSHLDIPATEAGAWALLELLRAQRLAEAEVTKQGIEEAIAKATTKAEADKARRRKWHLLGVGTSASPVQNDLDLWLKFGGEFPSGSPLPQQCPATHPRLRALAKAKARAEAEAKGRSLDIEELGL